jgi:hypothetical protein
VASKARSSSGRSTPAKSRGAGAGKSAGTAKRSSSSSGSRSTKRSSPAAKSRPRSRTAASSKRSSSAARTTRSTSSNGSGPNGAVSAVTDTIGSAARKASTPILAGGAAAAGLVGGMVLGKRVLGPRRTVLGIPVRKGLGLQPMAKEVHKAGKQIGRLTDELAQARKQAQKVGDALS